MELAVNRPFAPSSIAGSSPSPARRTGASRWTATACRSNGRSRCGGSTRTAPSITSPTPAGSTPPSPMRSDARSRPRMPRRRSRPRAGSRRLALHREHDDAFARSTPTCFRRRRIDALSDAGRAAFARLRPLLARAGRWARPAHPRRPASRQHRADRRRRCCSTPSNSSADRVGRRALRSRLPADGPGGAGFVGGGQYRVQPLPGRSEPRENLDALAALPLFLSMRAAIRAKVTAARRAHAKSDERPEIERSRSTYFDCARRFIAPAPPRLIAVGGLSGTGKSLLARALAPAISPAPGAVVLRSDVERKVLFGRASRAAAARRLHAGSNRAGLCRHRRQSAPRHRRRAFSNRRRGVRAPRRASTGRAVGVSDRVRISRPVPHRRSRRPAPAVGAREATPPTPTPTSCARRRHYDLASSTGTASTPPARRRRRCARQGGIRRNNPLGAAIAVGPAGFCTFINLYSPQALLPSLAANSRPALPLSAPS